MRFFFKSISSATIASTIFIMGFMFLIFMLIWQNYKKNKEDIHQMIVAEAKAHVDTMLLARSWGAGHGGVYVKQKLGNGPNVYLKDNILRTDKNETLIKINPAWMTRQMSEISKQRGDHYYSITSLKPLDPHNIPDSFEKEALLFFEKNKDQKYYYLFDESDANKTTFDLIGKLLVEESCLDCHFDQGYKIGDVRGGIRVTMQIENYNNALERSDNLFTQLFVASAFLALVFWGLIQVIIHMFYRHEKELIKQNIWLEDTVAKKTDEVKKMNSELEQRIETALEKNKTHQILLIGQSRHAAMGEMIGMIAHQWRQPITAISMAANNILLDIALDNFAIASAEKNSTDILAQTKHLSKTIDDFRNFFKPDNNVSKVKIKNVIEETYNIMKESLCGNHIIFKSSYESEVEVDAYQRELMQVFINIINNAKDALVSKNIKNAFIEIKVYEDDKYVNTEICDNGEGIDNSILEKIFDPYFTTKNEKNGTGLGLYVSKMIIEEHLHGIIEVSNRDGGACFLVRLLKSGGTQNVE